VVEVEYALGLPGLASVLLVIGLVEGLTFGGIGLENKVVLLKGAVDVFVDRVSFRVERSIFGVVQNAVFVSEDVTVTCHFSC